MRLLLILPRVEPEEINPPSECPYEDFDGGRFQFWQEVEKPLRDTKYSQVVAHRYQCLRCFRTHQVFLQRCPRDKEGRSDPLCTKDLKYLLCEHRRRSIVKGERLALSPSSR